MELLIQTRTTASARSRTTCSSRSSRASAAHAPPRAQTSSRAAGVASGFGSPIWPSATSRPARSRRPSPGYPFPASPSSPFYFRGSMQNRLRFGVILDIAQEMEKFMVTNFSVLELHLNPKGHAFPAFVFHLLRMHHVRTVVRRLKVILPAWFEESQTAKCLGNCPCNEPENWRSRSISLTYLEEVEIDYLRGGDYDIDLVRLIFRWAPLLKRMTIKLANEINQSEIGSYATTIHNICLAYPFCELFYLYQLGVKGVHVTVVVRHE